MQKKGQSKKAVSQIVTTILIILLALAAIVVVWNVIQKTVTEKSGEVDTEVLGVDVNIQKSAVYINETAGNLSLTITRGADDANLSSMKIIITGEADSATYELTKTSVCHFPNTLETQTCIFNINGLGNITKVSIYPILKEKIGIPDKYSITGNEPEIPPNNWTGNVTSPINKTEIPPGPGPGCTNECSPQNSTQCIVNINQICGNYDADSCLEWGNNDSCSDCSCSCGGYNTAESLSNNNCQDSLDNDCDTKIDSNEVECMPSNLILWLRFEGNAYDENGVYNGTILGNTNCNLTGKNGLGCYFDGNGDYVNTGYNVNLNTTSWTISLWAKNKTCTNWGDIFVKGWNYRITPLSCKFYIVIQNQLGADRTMTSTIGMSDSLWHHVIINYNITTNISQLYVDSVYQTQVVVQGIYSNTNSYTIGGGGSGGGSFNGTIDEVMIFNKALSAPEIQSIYDYQKS